ncbi:helix-turn-helix domain-containing protein [Roseburia intestinalis]|uniref:helix-turn-helix domain-containing protein n=1 Tax=Roseburia intestinalis TaxID=166486 RepID=UPI001FB14757|nr:helix-turn-helix domain-containing protein [Roseburia intestinalis]
MPELGQFLKEKREFSGLSLKKLSSVTGISDSELLKNRKWYSKKTWLGTSL